MEKRAQGRPSRATGVVGREKIIADIRHALRSVEGLEISRKSLARAIGVTPALITYYFPQADSLIEEIAVPVIEQHRIMLSRIVNRTDHLETKLRDIITLLHTLYGIDKKIFELYKEVEIKYPEDYAETSAMTAILSTFFGGGEDPYKETSFEAIVLQGAVRRMCEFAEHVRHEAARTADTMPPEAAPSWFESMCSLFAGFGDIAPGTPVTC